MRTTLDRRRRREATNISAHVKPENKNIKHIVYKYKQHAA